MKSPSPVKARKACGGYINGRLESLQMNPMPGDEWPLTPVAVLSLSPAASEARIEAGAKALYILFYSHPFRQVKGVGRYNWEKEPQWLKNDYLNQVRVIASSWGLLASAKEKGKKL